MKKLLFILPILLLAISCSNKPKMEKHVSDITNTKQVDSFRIINLSSANLYEKHCKMCHGIYGKGDGVKAKFDSTICPYDLTKLNESDKDLYNFILKGENKMPSQSDLKDEDIKLLIAYIKEFQNIDTSLFNIDTIKVIRMENFKSSNLYDFHCKMCHGNKGIGDGVKARHDSTICPYDLTKESKPDKDVYYIVLNGNYKMPGQPELKEDELWLIVLYIKKFR